MNFQTQKPVVKQMVLGSMFCVSYMKDTKYFYISDVASWAKCGHIKTILPVEVIIESDIKKMKKLKSLIKFNDSQQFILKHGKTHAIYNLTVHTYGGDTRDKIRSVGFTKIPNLHMCRCGG